MNRSSTSDHLTGASKLRKCIVVFAVFGLICVLPGNSVAAQRALQFDDKREYPLIEATKVKLVQPSLQKNLNGKTTKHYEFTSETGQLFYNTGWHGSHQYVCGVKGSPSTSAHYDFGHIARAGKYEIYAYWPGFEESVDGRNDGKGEFEIRIDGKSRRKWTEDKQFGGWERIELNSWYGWPTEDRPVARGQAVEVFIRNGDNKREGNCANGSRTVFPPLMLVRKEDYPKHRPYSPAHDIYPPAALAFADCIRSKVRGEEYTATDLWRDLTIAFGSALGADVSALKAYKASQSKNLSQLAGLCELHFIRDVVEIPGDLFPQQHLAICVRFGVLNQWHPPIISPNMSVASRKKTLSLSSEGLYQFVPITSTWGQYPQWNPYCNTIRDGELQGYHYGEDRERCVVRPPLVDKDCIEYVIKMMPRDLKMDSRAYLWGER